MVKGIAFALGACFIWGLIFVVPQYMEGFSSIEVALGRYLVYGLISALIFFKAKLHGQCRYSRAIWIKASYFSLATTIVYYTFAVLGMRYSTPAICALILGVSPVTIAFYGNWKQKETTYKSLIIPSILLLIGLVVINVPHLEDTSSPTTYLLGLLFSLVALASWSWYVVANARFLKHHPEVHSSDWSTMIGVATLFWVILLGLGLCLFFEEFLNIDRYFIFDDELVRFIVGSVILGILCSWVGAFLWNKASFYLPVSLAGQLTIFETIFGVLFVYLLAHTMPPLLECIGIVILLIAIIYGIRQFAQRKTYSKQLTPH